MTLSLLDYLVILAFIGLTAWIGFRYSKFAGSSLTHFFLGGRSFGWFLAGISMVATTFAADTPLAVNELVAKHGISGNWLWWSFLTGGMITTFFFARLWRRSEVMTDNEIVTLRYGGKASVYLRAFKSVYQGLFLNSLVIGWVNLAFLSILQQFFGIDYETAFLWVAASMVLVGLYSSASGLIGVAITDAIQFFIAMGGCIVLAVLVLQSDKIGGIDGLKTKLPEGSLDFFPTIGAEGTGKKIAIGLGSFLAYIGVQWWASWYPGAEPGGGGYVAQRMMSTKTEKDAVYSTLFFQVAHYAVRPWPWILVGLCSIILYPELPDADKRLGYIFAMRDFLPDGLKGLLLAAFAAAYMSTISTQLNLGSSYVINDFVKLFKPETDEKTLVKYSRVATIVLMLISLVITTQIESISSVWSFLLECGAGLGFVLILRWYWWRLNVWSEISATVVPLIFYGISKLGLGLEFPDSYFFTVGGTVITTLLITFLTPAESDASLKAFVARVQPGGWWGKFAAAGQKSNTVALWICTLSSIVLAYSALFMFGKLIFKEYAEAGLYFVGFVGGIAGLNIGIKRIEE